MDDAKYIKQAADEYSKSETNFHVRVGKRIGFVAGVKWRDENPVGFNSEKIPDDEISKMVDETMGDIILLRQLKKLAEGESAIITKINGEYKFDKK